MDLVALVGLGTVGLGPMRSQAPEIATAFA